MKSTSETLSPTRVKLSVEVPYAELKPRVDEAYKSIGQQVQIPGFRRGKVPPRLIDNRVGRGTVITEAVNGALPELFSQAVQEAGIRPIGRPSVELGEMPLEGETDLTFTVELDIVPEFDLPEYDGIALQVDVAEVDESGVETALTNLRQRFGTLTGVERAVQDGDFLSIDLRAAIGEDEIDAVEGVSYEVGSGTMLEGLDDAVIGLSAGEEATYTTPLAGGDRKGEDAEVTVKVLSVKERELPELEDDFASMASPFDTMDELMADLRSQAERESVFRQGVQARDKLLDHLLEAAAIPVPEGAVADEVHEHLERENRLEDDTHRAEVKESTEKQLQTELLLDKLADTEEVEVGQQELVEYIVMTAQQRGVNPNELAQQMDQQNQVPAVMAEVRRRKALALVLEKATVTDTDGNDVDLNALDEQVEDAEETDGADEAATEANAADAAAEADALADADETSAAKA